MCIRDRYSAHRAVIFAIAQLSCFIYILNYFLQNSVTMLAMFFLFTFAEYLNEFQWFSFAFLDEELFALKSPSSMEIDVYDADDYSSLGNITLPINFRGSTNFVDMAACCFYKCLCLANANAQTQDTCIVRLKLPPKLSSLKLQHHCQYHQLSN